MHSGCRGFKKKVAVYILENKIFTLIVAKMQIKRKVVSWREGSKVGR